MSPELTDETWAAHDRSVAAGWATYIDPATGYSVFTGSALERRGYCCGNLCRHCPYEPTRERRARRRASAGDSTSLADQAPG